MASQEAHDWWSDVQDERDALGTRGRRRPVVVWADEDEFDLMPAHVMARRPVSDELAPRRAARAPEAAVADVPEIVGEPDVVEAPVRGHRFVRTHRVAAEAPRRIVLEGDREIDHVMPPRGEGVVQITGRPEDRRAPLPARYERRPSRTARELVEHQPDRIMFWVTALGFLLILLAFATG